MRVAVLSRANGLVNRGVESWSINLCRQLESLGHTCLLIQGGPDIPIDAPYKTVALPVGRRREFRWAHEGRIATLLGRCYLDAVDREIAHFAILALPHLLAFRPDIIVPASNFWTVVAAKVAGWFQHGSPRIVVTAQAGWGYLEQDDLRLGIDGFVALQPHTYDGVRRFKHEQALIRLIPNGVDIEHFVDCPAADIPLTRPVAIVVSALDDYKRVDLAVQATARAGMSLLVLGDGPNAARVDELGAGLLGPGRFLRLARVPYDQIAAYYRAANVFTLPSTQGEAFGIVIIEAMAAKLPIVVNDDPVRRWIAGEQGFFVNPADTDAYAAALR